VSRSSTWATSVHEMLGLFRDALIALIPSANRAHMSWREPDAYDDWDQICEAIYQSFVVQSVENAEEIGTFFPIPKYDMRIISYDGNSFISEQSTRERAAFVCFETHSEPFDTCLFATLDMSGKIIGFTKSPLSNVRMIFARRDKDGLKFFDHLVIRL